MKRFKCLLMAMLVLVTTFAFSACFKNELTLIFEHTKNGVTKDATPMHYIGIDVIVIDAESDILFNASDFSILRNGVKENGVAFIVETHFEDINGQLTWTSKIETTFMVENNHGSYLEIVFSGTDNVTELYYKSQKIDCNQDL